jgi:ribosomal protein S18 acetylase RimI-like enzyme
MQKSKQSPNFTIPDSLSIRSVNKTDLHDLANLIHFETYVHRHLDYRPPLDWVGSSPFYILERYKQIVGALSCPPDPPEVAWIRLFAASHQVSPEKVWYWLWRYIREELNDYSGLRWAAAIPIHKWFEALVKKSGFERLHRIILLSWQGDQLPEAPRTQNITIRPMAIDDLKNVEGIDQASFIPLWQNSQSYLEVAFRQAVVATVAIKDEEIIGYQISTATPMGGHLARLAVHPSFQGLGIGQTLLCDLLEQFQRRGARAVTVNTQHDNQASMKLYKKVGFHPTGEEYPIYYLPID